MTENMIECMTLTDDETEEYIHKFLTCLEKRQKKFDEDFKLTGKKEVYYYIVRNALWDTFGSEVLLTAFLAFMGEFSAICYTMFLSVLITYLKNPEIKYYWGILYLVIFALMMLCSSVFRNQYIMKGSIVALKIRKTVISAMYGKVAKLSMRSLTETNSGKLITIVSGDI